MVLLAVTRIASLTRIRVYMIALVVMGSLIGIRGPDIRPGMIQRVSVFEGIAIGLIMAAYTGIVVGCRLGAGSLDFRYFISIFF